MAGVTTIEDFDIAMKSQLGSQYFRMFLDERTHYLNHQKGKTYFKLFQLMYIYYLKQQDLNKKMNRYLRKIENKKKAHSPQISDIQKELIVEIIRVLD